ncbi:hypothetical protein J4G48_0049280 (plasmid) [Bradyrhizobium barranii subsp. apii]|nr:hypothetical protein [Bradyrhizobium barranii]UPU01399.1 hypothetical protein J4G48_0049280 [Bradyrhizobium barranii subsp. apii]
MEAVDHLVNVIPGTVHPEIRERKVFALEHLDQAGGVVVVGVRQHHVLDLCLRSEVLLDVRNDLVTSIGEAPVDQLEVEITIFGLSVFDDDGVAVAISGAEKVMVVGDMVNTWNNTRLLRKRFLKIRQLTAE